MMQFSAVVRELRKWLTSFAVVNVVLPFAQYTLFGGLGLLFLYELLLKILPYSSYDTIDLLFTTIPLYAIGYFAFFSGIWLTLISPRIRELPIALWGYAFVILFPFEGLTLLLIVRAVIYILAGWALFRYTTAVGAGREGNPYSG
ncbi:hypothetical protein [Cohnella zeiphila]|uniref:Uncharacterized protein n=1 Tax=Cohnella zeiphila TaxID=2761120 RepID=A0A7X0SKM1_9BACL|nr:hypothetical protein [Cohnella zeiphila]MBB6731750.1 hypothetical protein [Cohnella zeiphila]